VARTAIPRIPPVIAQTQARWKMPALLRRPHRHRPHRPTILRRVSA
jgi:hypothetical protein